LSPPPNPPEGAVVRRSSNQPTISPWLFVMATALNTTVASLLAVIITLGVVRQEQTGGPSRDTTQGAAHARAAGEPVPLMTLASAMDLRSIGAPDQPLRLEARKPARLPLQILPDDAARESFILVLAGAPAGTTLSGATRIGADTWLLPPGGASRVEITMPEWSTSLYEIGVQLRRTNGLVAAQSKAWIAVPPPPQMMEASAGKIDAVDARDLVAQGDRLLDKGEVVAARTVYQRAAEMGSGAAALALGSTYDPNLLWSLGALGMVGNKERARQWYARADELGHPNAKSRLRSLGN
jgi:hypothetical protein